MVKAKVLVSLDKDINSDLIKPFLSDDRLIFLVQDKGQYVVLKNLGFNNLVLQTDLNMLDSLDIQTYNKICVDYDMFVNNQVKLNPWIESAKVNNNDALYVFSTELSVQEKQSVETLKSLPNFVKLVVNYDNAFNSDF